MVQVHSITLVKNPWDIPAPPVRTTTLPKTDSPAVACKHRIHTIKNPLICFWWYCTEKEKVRKRRVEWKAVVLDVLNSKADKRLAYVDNELHDRV